VVDLLQIIENVVGMLPSFETLFMLVSMLMGVLFVILSLQGLSRRNDMGRGAGSWAAPITTFGIGVSFLALPGLIDILTRTFFAQDTPDASRIFEYAPTTLGLLEDGPGRAMIQGIVSIVMFVGVIGVMRGLYLLNQTAQGGGGPKTFGPGLTFVIAGVMAVNFPLFVGMMERLVSG